MHWFTGRNAHWWTPCCLCKKCFTKQQTRASLRQPRRFQTVVQLDASYMLINASSLQFTTPNERRWALTSHSIRLLWTWIVFPWSIKTKVPVLRHLENFWPVIVSWVIKKKENHNPNSNPDIAYYSREYITSVTTKALVTNGGIGRL